MNCKVCKKRFVCACLVGLLNLDAQLFSMRNYEQTGLIRLSEWQAPVDDLGPQFCGNQFEEETS